MFNNWLTEFLSQYKWGLACRRHTSVPSLTAVGRVASSINLAFLPPLSRVYPTQLAKYTKVVVGNCALPCLPHFLLPMSVPTPTLTNVSFTASYSSSCFYFLLNMRL